MIVSFEKGFSSVCRSQDLAMRGDVHSSWGVAFHKRGTQSWVGASSPEEDILEVYCTSTTSWYATTCGPRVLAGRCLVCLIALFERVAFFVTPSNLRVRNSPSGLLMVAVVRSRKAEVCERSHAPRHIPSLE